MLERRLDIDSVKLSSYIWKNLENEKRTGDINSRKDIATDAKRLKWSKDVSLTQELWRFN